jgi:Hexameric tyrosine-coordinated heme protein (HTHP)
LDDQFCSQKNTNSGDFDMNNVTAQNNSPVVTHPEVTLIPNNSLLTDTPEEGRQLAVKMARLIIKLTQPDEEKRNQLRDVYGNDAMMLIAVGQTVATEFATIAAANNYWRK